MPAPKAEQVRLAGLQLALKPIRKQRQARPDVADHLGVREVDLLDVGRRIADMDHLRPALAHEEGRLLDRVVADGDDQIGPVHRPVHVVALGERGGAHVEVGPARDRALAHLRVEERQLRALHERRELLGHARTACRRPEHDERVLGREDHLGRPVERRRVRDRHVDRVRGHERHRLDLLAGHVLRQLQMHRTGPLLLATRNASRTIAGIEAALTIWRVILVSGFMEATMSTIWKRAWRAVMIAFWPVIRIIGMAPRCA